MGALNRIIGGCECQGCNSALEGESAKLLERTLRDMEKLIAQEAHMVRAKVHCQLVERFSDGSGNAHFHPVYSGSPENEAFWKATPGGTIILYTVNPQALAQFEQGKEYYLDFTPA